MNFKQINWETMSTTVGNNHPANKFLSTIEDCYMFQHVKDPTRYREGQVSNILDLIITNEEGMVENLEYNPSLGSSDHLVLAFDLIVYVDSNPKDNTKTRYNFHKGDYETIRQNLTNIQLQDIENCSNVSEAWEVFSQQLDREIRENIPLHQTYSQRNSKPYISKTAKDAVRRKRKCWTKYLHCKSAHNFAEYKMARNRATQTLRHSKYYYEKDLADKIKTNPKLFWKYVRTKTNTATTIGNVTMPSGELTSTSEEIANTMNKYFASVFTAEERIRERPHLTTRNYAEPLETITVTVTQVEKAINKINPNKSPGPDNIHSMLLAKTVNEIKSVLTIIFNKSIQEGTLPDPWKKANVCPIFKKGSRKDPSN
ncbi:uncharacterized protein [Argopecten irradians]|uniref:uncharacterized protein n=1 Tax=Argopecten irradians TaxID=31199 RepID=UPI003719BFB6